MSSDLTAQIRLSLQSQSLPVPSASWVQALIAARSPPPALPSLLATAKARLLAADLTTPNLLDVSTAALPADIANAEVKETKLPRDTVVQVLDVENLSRSRWEQVEDLEAVERGEQRAGRRIVRLPTAAEEDEDEGGGSSVSSAPAAQQGSAAGAQAKPAGNATHRLVLQDCKGTRLYALELKRVARIGVGTTMIGEKILLSAGAVVARGTLLLEPTNCAVLGGKVEAWHAAWVTGRLKRLREAVGAEDRPK